MKQSRSLIQRSLFFIRPYLIWIVAGQITMLLAVGLQMVFPWVVKDIFDTMIARGNLNDLWYLVLGLTGVFSLQSLVSYARTLVFAYVGENVVRDMRIKLYENVQHLSFGFFEEHPVGEIISRLTNDISLLQNTLTSGITRLLQHLVSAIVGIGILLYLDAQLTIVSFVVIPLVIAAGKHLGQKIRTAAKDVQQQVGQVTSFMDQTLSGIAIIKGFRLENYVVQRFGRESAQLLQQSLHSVKLRAKLGSSVGFLNDLILVVVMGYGGYRVMAGPMTAGELIAFILYVQSLTGPLSQLTDVYANAQQGLAAAERVFEFMDETPQILDPPDPVQPTEIGGTITFNQVSFAYASGAPVLNAINFHVAAGETIALVGPSGAGKSTIAKLVCRFYDVQAGEVQIDGIDIRRFGIDALRSQIAIVMQEPYLFGISVRDNIACGNVEANDEQIVRAAKAAQAHEFIEQLPEGYATLVGEGGMRLSGGQRQRIAIARAILRQAKIIILDEATSALDTESESKVQAALSQLAASRTMLVIAHRLSTVENANRILVIDQGRIVQQGTHQQLLTDAGLYSRLYHSKFLPQRPS